MSDNLFYLFYLSPYYLFHRVIFSLIIIFLLFLLLLFVNFVRNKKASKLLVNKKQNNLSIIQSIVLVFVTLVFSVWISSTPNIIPSNVSVLDKTELLNLTSNKTKN